MFAQRLAADYVFSGHTHHFSAQDWYCRPEDAAEQMCKKYGWDIPEKKLRQDNFIALNFNLPKASRGYMIGVIEGNDDDISFQYFNTRR